MIQVQTKFGNDIVHLFEDEKYSGFEIIKRGFAAPATIDDQGILFLGLNPSYSDKAVFGGGKAIAGSGYYTLNADNNYRYFSKFAQMAKALGHSWGHLDLLFLRETSQKTLLKFLDIPDGRKFAWHNLQISKRILEESSPKVIVVENTLARVLLGAEKTTTNLIWMGYDFEFDDQIGTYRISTKDSKLCNLPVFFTGMLTGQRALDLGSLKRLQWHVGKVLEMQKQGVEVMF